MIEELQRLTNVLVTRGTFTSFATLVGVYFVLNFYRNYLEK
jgi:hypothetical protein